jgi:hypothetical protein
MAGKIFISYRRADLDVIGRLVSHLQRAFQPEQLIVDIDGVDPGVNFVDVLSRLIGECEVVLAVIGDGWLGARDAAGARRFDNPDDFVRIEIEAAFRQGKRLIPVLIGDTQIPSADELPKAIQPLTNFHAMRLTHSRFSADAQNLIKVLQRALGEAGVAPEIPAQGFGPHFEIGDDGIITFAPPAALDQQGNNLARLTKMHPSLRELSRVLNSALGKGNVPHSYLLARSEAYHELIDQDIERIDFALLYIAGVRLANAEKAAAGDNELPSLPSPVRETIDSLLQLHGTFMLASVEGIEAIAAEQRYQRTRQEEVEYRAAAVDFARSLQNQPMVVDPKVASTILSAVEEIGKGANPERSGTVATGLMKNVTITFSIAAALGALSTGALASGSASLIAVAGAAVLVATDGLRKSKPFAALSALVARGIDQTAHAEISAALENLSARFKPQLRFFLLAEPHFKRLGRNEEFNWLTKTVHWLEQQARAHQREGRQHRDPVPPADPQPLSKESRQLVGNIYLAKVDRVEPSLQAAFVDYDGERHGFLALSEINPDYYQVSFKERQRLIDQENQAYRMPEFARQNDQDGVDSRQDHAGRPDDLPAGSSDVPDRRPHIRNNKIQDLIKRRQVMLVQILKDERGTKNATLTTYLSLAGRYLVLTPNNSVRRDRVSRKIEDTQEHSRLMGLIQELEVPEGMGVIVRNAAVSRTRLEIQTDFEYLMRVWETVRDFTLKSAAPTLVYEPGIPPGSPDSDQLRNADSHEEPPR